MSTEADALKWRTLIASMCAAEKLNVPLGYNFIADTIAECIANQPDDQPDWWENIAYRSIKAFQASMQETVWRPEPEGSQHEALENLSVIECRFCQVPLTWSEKYHMWYDKAGYSTCHQRDGGTQHYPAEAPK